MEEIEKEPVELGGKRDCGVPDAMRWLEEQRHAHVLQRG